MSVYATARTFLTEADGDVDSRLSREEFHHLIQFISADVVGTEDQDDFDELMDVLNEKVDVSFQRVLISIVPQPCS